MGTPIKLRSAVISYGRGYTVLQYLVNATLKDGSSSNAISSYGNFILHTPSNAFLVRRVLYPTKSGILLLWPTIFEIQGNMHNRYSIRSIFHKQIHCPTAILSEGTLSNGYYVLKHDNSNKD